MKVIVGSPGAGKSKRRVSTTVVHIIPLIVALGVILPFGYVLLMSIQHVYYLHGDPRLWIPRIPTIDTYTYIITETSMVRWMINSLIVAISVTAIGLFVYSAAGYAFYINRSNKYINGLFGLILLGIMVPKAVTMIPAFIIVREFHWINTYFGLIVPPLAIPVGVFLIRQAMFSFPMDIVDSARIDGCSELGIFIRVVFPVLRASLVVVGIYTFMEQWREFLWPLVVTTTQEMKTIPVGLSTFSSEFRTDWGIFMAGVMLAIIPGLVAFLLFQQQFIKGLTAGALKE